MAYTNQINSNMYIKTGVKNKTRIISIQQILDKIEDKFEVDDINQAADAILGLHTFTGCDTVSAFCRKGKFRQLNLVLKNQRVIERFAQVAGNWNINEGW